MYALGIIDIQNDFMNPDGALYVPGAERIKTQLAEEYAHAVSMGYPIFFTADEHDGTEPEMAKNGGLFPLHCMKGTDGQKLIREIKVIPDDPVFTKRCYNVFDDTLGNMKIRGWLKDNKVTEIGLVGLVGNICLKAAALGLVKLGIKVTILENIVVWMNIDEQNNEIKAREELVKAGVHFQNANNLQND
jgi:nicotinamidase/pyrazinamidase